MNAATAISAYGERISGIELRVDALSNQMDDRFSRIDACLDRIEQKVDDRFGWQTVMMAALALIVLFDDVIRGVFGF